jgi:hypothetical protein
MTGATSNEHPAPFAFAGVRKPLFVAGVVLFAEHVPAYP